MAKDLAPRARFELATLRLIAECSLSPSILKVTVLPLGDCFVQTSIICPRQLCAAILVPELLTRQIRWSQCETRRGLRGRPPESVNHRHKFRSRNRDRKDEPRSQ